MRAFIPIVPNFPVRQNYIPQRSTRPAYSNFRCCAHAPSTLTTQDFAQALQTRAKSIDRSSTDILLDELSSYSAGGKAPSQETLENMVIHLGDDRGMARLGIVEAFGRIGALAVPILLQGLEECPNPVVRRSCGKALAKIGDDSATEALIHALVYDEDTVTRSSAAGALAKMGPTAVPRLLQLISDDTINMTAKGHAAWAVAFMQGDAKDAVFNELHHDSPDVRVAVVNALGAVAIGDGLPVIGSVGDDDWDEEDAEGRKEMRRKAIEGLQKALGDEVAEVRMEAATALANAGCTEEVSRISDLLTDENEEMRRCAALALMKLGDPSVIGLLRERQNNGAEEPGVRSVAKLAADMLERNTEEEEWDDE